MLAHLSSLDWRQVVLPHQDLVGYLAASSMEDGIRYGW